MIFLFFTDRFKRYDENWDTIDYALATCIIVGLIIIIFEWILCNKEQKPLSNSTYLQTGIPCCSSNQFKYEYDVCCGIQNQDLNDNTTALNNNRFNTLKPQLFSNGLRKHYNRRNIYPRPIYALDHTMNELQKTISTTTVCTTDTQNEYDESSEFTCNQYNKRNTTVS